MRIPQWDASGGIVVPAQSGRAKHLTGGSSAGQPLHPEGFGRPGGDGAVDDARVLDLLCRRRRRSALVRPLPDAASLQRLRLVLRHGPDCAEGLGMRLVTVTPPGPGRGTINLV